MFFRKYFSSLMLCILLAVLLFLNLSKINHPAIEFDEGVYLTTFQLANAGHPLYHETFFSQFPGFYIAVNPLFVSLGQTLQAGRLGIIVWSFIGLIASIWIGYEIALPIFSLIAIACLYFIPVYTTEILTFHTDSLSPVFSLLALAACLRFMKSGKKLWLLAVTLALAIAVLIKLDVTVIPSLAVLFCFLAKKQKPKPLILSIFFSFFALLFFLTLFTIPFGIGDILKTIISFRVLVTSHTMTNPSLFLTLLLKQTILVTLLIIGTITTIVALLRKFGDAKIHIALLLWAVTTCAALLLYHPLFPHHLFLLTVPSVLLFSYPISLLLKQLRIADTVSLCLFFLLIVIFVSQTTHALAYPGTIETNNEQTAIKIVTANSKLEDFIVSDDGIINGVTRRLAPPDLADLSYVRIQTGNLTPERFAQSLGNYQPKLIVVWTNRLNNLPDFENVLVKYHYKLIYENAAQQKIYSK